MVEVVEVGGIHDTGMGTKRVLGAVQVEVAVSDVGILADGCHKVLREAVAHPETGGVPVVSPRLLLLVGAGNGKHSRDALEVGYHALAVARLAHNEQLAIALVAPHQALF